MSNELALQILEHGLIELGVFQEGAIQRAWRWRLDLLPSYPNVLTLMTDAARKQMQNWDIDRLVCTPEALPWATSVALNMGIPLIYSRGRGEAPLYDLVGAYDVGHKACLLTHTLSNMAEIRRVIAGGEKTGFMTDYVLAICGDGMAESTELPPLHSLVTLHDLAALAPEYLPIAQAEKFRLHNPMA
jgi:hypothetical protein